MDAEHDPLDVTVGRLLAGYEPVEPDPAFEGRLLALLEEKQRTLGRTPLAPARPVVRRNTLGLHLLVLTAAAGLAIATRREPGVAETPSRERARVRGDSPSEPEPVPAPRPVTPSPQSAPPAWERETGETPSPLPAPPVGERGTELTAATPTRAPLPDGSVLFLDRGASARVAPDGPRTLRLDRGRAFLEVAPSSTPFRVVTTQGEAVAHGTKLALDSTTSLLEVAVAQGLVALRGRTGPELRLAAGDVGHVGSGVAPVARPSERLSHVVAWARELYGAGATTTPPAPSTARLVVADAQGRESSLSVRRLHVDVHLEDGVARTTIDTTYFNHLTSRQEGTFIFPVPPGASISRLAMYVEGKLMEGGVAERDHARNVYESIVHARRDPALLEWLEGNLFRMRIFPLEPRQERRVLVSFTQDLDALYGTLRYVLPLQVADPVRAFSIALRVRGGAATQVECPTYPLALRRDGDDLVGTLEQASVRPGRDLVVSVPTTLEAAPPAVSVLEGVEHAFFQARFPVPPAPRMPLDVAGPRHFFVLFDASASRSSADLRVQREVVARLVAELDDRDRVKVVALDGRVRDPGAGFVPARGDARAALAFLDQVPGLGATDLEAGLRAAAAALAPVTGGHVVYVGDGIASQGERGPGALAALLPRGVPFVGVAVGRRVDDATLTALAGASGGRVVSVNQDEPLAWRVFDLVQSLAAPRITGLEACCVDARGRAVAAELHVSRAVAAEGDEVRVIGRVQGKLPARVVLEGRRGGAPWSAEVAIQGARAEAFSLPRLWARGRVERLVRLGADAHKAEITALGKAHFLATPFTSLLVLERDEQYAQFGIVRGGKERFAPYVVPERIPVVTEPVEPSAAVAPPAPIRDARDVVASIAGDRSAIQTWSWGASPDLNGNVSRSWFLPRTRSIDLPGNLPVVITGTPADGFSVGTRLNNASVRTSSEPSAVTGATPWSRSQGATKARDSFYRRIERDEESGIATQGNRGGTSPGQANDIGFGRRIFQTPSSPAPGLDDFAGEMSLSQAESTSRARGGAGGDLAIPFFGSLFLGGRIERVLDGGADDTFLGFRSYGRREAVPGLWGEPAFEWVDRASTADLTLFIPGLRTLPADVLATIDAELGAPAGKHDPAARVVLERARAAFGVRSFSYVHPRDGFRGFAAGDGRLVLERRLPGGLEERLVAGRDAIHQVWPEVGLAARRPRSGFHELELLGALAPFLPPAASALEGFDVSLRGEATVVIAPSARAGVPPRLRLELDVATNGRIVERRVVRLADGAVVLRTRIGADFALELQAGAAPWRRVDVIVVPVPERDVDFHPPLADVVVLDLPARTVAQADARFAAATAEAKPHAEVQLAFAALASRAPRPDVLRDRIGSGDRRLGIHVLRAALTGGEPVPGLAELGPAGARLRAYYDLRAARAEAPARAALVAGDGLVGGLARFVVTLQAIDVLYGADRSASRTAVDRALAYAEGAPSSELLLALAHELIAKRVAPLEVDRLLRLLELAARDPAAAFEAREAGGRILHDAGRLGDAALYFESAYGAARDEGVFPPFGRALRNALHETKDGARTRLDAFLAKSVGWAVEARNPRALLTLADSLRRTALSPEADRVLRALPDVVTDATSDDVRFVLARLWQSWGHPERAETLVRDLVRRPAFARDAALHEYASQLGEERGRTAAAVADLERAIALDEEASPDVVELASFRVRSERLLHLYGALAKAACVTADDARAVAAKARAVAPRWRAIDRGNERVYAVAASAFVACGEDDEAWDWATTPVELHPGEARGFVFASDVLANERKPDVAADLRARAFRAEPTDPTHLLQEAALRERAGHRDAARALRRRIVEGTWQERYRTTVEAARAALGQ